MENIMRRLANASKAVNVVDRNLTEPSVSSSGDVTDTVSKNQDIFRTIFGEEPPSWWGNFSSVLN